MTRKEAIGCLEYQNDTSFGGQSEALTMAIEALELVTSYEGTINKLTEALNQQTCEDCISKEAVGNMLNRIQMKKDDTWYDYYHKALKELSELPPVYPKQKEGHWIRWYEQKEIEWYIENVPRCKCSECGKEYDPHSSQFIKYCNECGAKMKVGE